MSNVARELAAIVVDEATGDPAKFKVNVAEVAAVLHTTILVTIVLVADGVVYKVVFDVLAAPLNNFFAVVATMLTLP
jgi:hypothetical protein